MTSGDTIIPEEGKSKDGGGGGDGDGEAEDDRDEVRVDDFFLFVDLPVLLFDETPFFRSFLEGREVGTTSTGSMKERNPFAPARRASSTIEGFAGSKSFRASGSISSSANKSMK